MVPLRVVSSLDILFMREELMGMADTENDGGFV